MQMFTVSFFGHRRIERWPLADRLVWETVAGLLRDHDFVRFLVGRDGDFDQIVSSAVVRARRELRADNSCHVWVMPYVRADYRRDAAAYEAYYDEVELFEPERPVPPRAALVRRNRSMVDRSDLCVFFVETASGGAFQTMRYALRRHKALVNLADRPG
ncbi:MAG: hypothetical protein IJL69_04435 [Oscillospiraceae bacterium]|nr:hypothetical protein [Oscillospiraceae bacterium]